ncbi:MAG: energy-coupled thiamine transporter ThiT [Eubacteriaceae bacterium]|nr:energy-coupled thiamine transporter ThiT [Eubacteriaceae bacterium]
MKQRSTAKQLAMSGVFIAMAFVLNNFTKIHMPFGGAITLFSMFMIFLPGYCFGWKIGTLAAVAYGLLDLLFGPTIVHPVQVLLDYPLAFGMLGFGSIFATGRFALQKGYIAGVIGRLIMSTISGAIFFAEYAPVGQNAWVYSLSYQATYLGPEATVTLILLFIPAVARMIGELKKRANQ